MTGTTARAIGGILLMLLGAVWVLQGLNLLPGSFMTGSAFWGIVGAITFLAGALVLVRALGSRGNG